MESTGHPAGTYWHDTTPAAHYDRMCEELPNYNHWKRGIRTTMHHCTEIHCLSQEPAVLDEYKLVPVATESLKSLVRTAWKRHGDRRANDEYPVLNQFENDWQLVHLDFIYDTIQAADQPLEAKATISSEDMRAANCVFQWPVFDDSHVWDPDARQVKTYLHLLSGQRSTHWQCATSTERIVVARGNCRVAVAIANRANIKAYTEHNEELDPINLFRALNPTIYQLTERDVLHFWPGSVYIIICDDPLVLWRYETHYGHTMGAQLAAMQANVARGFGTPKRYAELMMKMTNIYLMDLDSVRSWCGGIDSLIPNHYMPLRDAARFLDAHYPSRRQLDVVDYENLFGILYDRSVKIQLPLDEPDVLKRLLNVDDLAKEQRWTRDKETGSTVAAFENFIIAAKSSPSLARMQNVWSGAPNEMFFVKMFLETLRMLCVRNTAPVAGFKYPCTWLAMRTGYPNVLRKNRELKALKDEIENKIVISPRSEEARNMLVDLALQQRVNLAGGIMELVELIAKEDVGAVASRTRRSR